jgi:hypothetical protein
VHWRINIGPFRWKREEKAEGRRASLRAAGAVVHLTDDGDLVTIELSAPTETDASLRAARLFRDAALYNDSAYHVRVPVRIEPLARS